MASVWAHARVRRAKLHEIGTAPTAIAWRCVVRKTHSSAGERGR